MWNGIPLPLLLLGAIGICLLLLLVQAMFAYGPVVSRDRVDSSAAKSRENPESFDEDADYLAWKARKDRFKQHLAARLGARRPTDALNYESLKARNQAPLIRKLVQEELPNYIRNCVRTHRLSAVAARADFIHEVSDKAECFALRERVVEVAEGAVNMIETYPLLPDDPLLIGNLIAVREGILPTCRNCPYLEYGTAQAPEHCPSAEIVFGKNAGVQPENPQDHDHQG